MQENVDQTMSTLSRAGASLVEVRGLPAAEISDVALAMVFADFPASVAHYFNRHRVYDRSAFELMHELHMDSLKEAWLPGMDNAPRGEGISSL